MLNYLKLCIFIININYNPLGEKMVFEIFAGVAIWAAVPLRLALGVAFLAHGYPKLSGASAKQTRDFMKTVGVPPALTTLTALLEFLGGIAFVIGFLTRIAGILIVLE